MDSKEILNFCLKKGILVNKDVLNLFSENEDSETTKFIIEKFCSQTQQKIITKDFDKYEKRSDMINIKFEFDSNDKLQKNISNVSVIYFMTK